MKLFWSPTAKRRARQFRALTEEWISSFQKERWPSCIPIVMPSVDECIKESRDDFLSFPPDYDYEELALGVIRNITYEMVTSGHFHVYRGVLKPIGYQLAEVCIQSAFKSKVKGYLSDEFYQEFVDSLYEGINTLG